MNVEPEVVRTMQDGIEDTVNINQVTRTIYPDKATEMNSERKNNKHDDRQINPERQLISPVCRHP